MILIPYEEPRRDGYSLRFSTPLFFLVCFGPVLTAAISRYVYDLSVSSGAPFTLRPLDGEVESFDVRLSDQVALHWWAVSEADYI